MAYCISYWDMNGCTMRSLTIDISTYLPSHSIVWRYKKVYANVMIRLVPCIMNRTDVGGIFPLVGNTFQVIGYYRHEFLYRTVVKTKKTDLPNKWQRPTTTPSRLSLHDLEKYRVA